MTTPNLIVQHRELARSIRELRRQNEQSLDAMAAARDHDIAAAEQARLHANRPYDAHLAEFLALEQGARAVVKFTGAKASDAVVETPPLMPITDPAETLTECKSEIERILAGLPNSRVILRLVDVPPDVDQAKVRGILRVGGEVPVSVGHWHTSSLRRAREIIPKLKELGIEAELVV
ncbi:MAG: hypothetical protein IPO15_01365 [Anaerolineae bacterium]|uniref:hypothetical protein n=1 Tax=Candidatus Amarolinea dominans TaxID=3140696 RepID=UPI0031375CEC|nr:hypothetical protein [Anaerolineae bacterium]